MVRTSTAAMVVGLAGVVLGGCGGAVIRDDGGDLASATPTLAHTVALWPESHTCRVVAAAWTSDGAVVAADACGGVRRWGAEPAAVEAATDEPSVLSAAFDDEGSWLGRDRAGTRFARMTALGSAEKTWQTPELGERPRVVAVGPGGSHVWVWLPQARRVSLWQRDAAAATREIDLGMQADAVAVAPGGARLAACGEGRVRVFDVAAIETVEVELADDCVDVDWREAGAATELVVSMLSGEVALLRGASLEIDGLWELGVPGVIVASGDSLFHGDDAGTIRAWRADGSDEPSVAGTHEYTVTLLAAKDGRLVSVAGAQLARWGGTAHSEVVPAAPRRLVAGAGPDLLLVERSSRWEALRADGMRWPITSGSGPLAVLGARVVTRRAGGLLISDVERGTQQAMATGSAPERPVTVDDGWELPVRDFSPLTAIAASPSAEFIALASGEQVRLIEVSQGRALADWTFDRPVAAVAVSPSGTRVAVAVGDRVLLRTVDGSDEIALNVRAKPREVQWPAEDRLAVRTSEGVSVWEPGRSSPIGTMALDPMTAYALSARGWLAVARGATIEVSDPSGRPGLVVRPERGRIEAIAFGPAGTRLWVATEDAALTAWDLGLAP